MRVNLLTLILGFILTGLTGFSQDSFQIKQQKNGILQRTNFTPIPIVSYNRSFGITLGGMLNAFTDLKSNDTISPPSMTVLGLGYTQNKSYFGVLYQRLFLKEDTWRVIWKLGLGRKNFQFFLEEEDAGGNGDFVNFQTYAQFVNVSASYNVFSRFYAGLSYGYRKTVTEFADGVRPDEVVHLSGFGIPITFDSRDYVYNPSYGWLLNIAYNAFPTWLGSDVTFSSLSGFANNYKSLNSKAVLATRLYVYSGLGDVPFVGQKVVGGKDLRGYTQGEFRSDALTAIQSEFRYTFNKRWGAVGFGGFAYTFPYDGVPSSGILPSIGAGLRYMAIPKRKMNAGVDLAFGKNDWGIYFRVGEVF
jgi:outer membrane protein assembly factor BamA